MSLLKKSAPEPVPQKEDDVLLGLDIGTEYVKAVIARQSKTGLEIIGVGRAHQAPNNMYSGAIADIPAVTRVCEKALAQADDYGHSFKREVAFLTVHSMLHLLGYDHERSEEEEREMFGKQEIVLEAMGLTR